MGYRRLTSLAVGAALLVAACGGGDDDSSDESVASAATASSGTGGGAEDADVRSGTFRYATSFVSTGLDPHRASTGNDHVFLFPIYDRLVHMSADAEPIPGLATDWGYSDDGLSLTFTLREGVEFQDGEPFNAEAARLNLERAMTLEGSTVAGELASVASVEAPGEYELVLQLSEPNAALPAILAGRPGMMISPAAMDDPELDRNPVGAGMFEVESVQVGNLINMAAWDGYWDPDAVKVDRFEMYIMPDGITRWTGLQAGDLDAIVLDPSQVDEVESNGDFDILSRTTLQLDRFYLNRGEPPFDDPLVRQAVNHAIDREAIVESVVFGQGEPTVQQFPSDYYAASPNVGLDYYEYDPDKARELLAEAGYPDGFEYDQIVPAGPTYEPVAEAVMAQLREVGIDAKPQLVEPAASVTAYVIDQTGQATMGATGGRFDPAILFQLLFMPDGFFNPGKDASEEVIDLYGQQLAETDPAAREELVHQLVDQLAEEADDVALYALVNNLAVADNVSGLEPQLIGFAGMEFRGVSVS